MISNRMFTGWRRAAVLAMLCVAIVLWQVDSIARVRRQKAPRYPLDNIIGMCSDIRNLLHFYYYYGVVPVATVAKLPLTRTQADQLITDHGELLVMDVNLAASTTRSGDFGKLLLLLPTTWWYDAPGMSSVIPVDEFLFIASLLAVLLASASQDLIWFGLVMVLLAGSDPFQREQLELENIFSLPITFALLTLALNLPLISAKFPAGRWAWLAALLSGVMLACAREIRTEAALIVLILPLIYLTVPRTPWRRRLLLLAVVTASYFLTATGWSHYWNYKYDQTTKWVIAHGGHPYTGIHDVHHNLWHAVWCGLGDFDTRFGYKWDDRWAYKYATPKLINDYGLPISYSGGPFLDQTYPPEHIYRICPSDFPQYVDIIRAKILSDIATYPGWYATILCKRAWKILTDPIPLTVAAFGFEIQIPYLMFLVPPALCWALWRRNWVISKLIVFSVPLSLTPLLIYSGGGTTYYGILHLMTVAALIQWAISAAHRPSQQADQNAMGANSAAIA